MREHILPEIGTSGKLTLVFHTRMSTSRDYVRRMAVVLVFHPNRYGLTFSYAHSQTFLGSRLYWQPSFGHMQVCRPGHSTSQKIRMSFRSSTINPAWFLLLLHCISSHASLHSLSMQVPKNDIHVTSTKQHHDANMRAT